MIYALGIGALLIALSGGWAWVQGVRLDAVKAELADCTIRYNETLKLVEKQNETVKADREATRKALERGKAALVEAKRGADTSKRTVDRLKAELGKKPVTGCPAGEGVKVVRDGLK